MNISDIISCDPVEPMFFIDALRMAPEFGPGIFGEEYWSVHAQELESDVVRERNPVVDADIENSACTHLQLCGPFIIVLS